MTASWRTGCAVALVGAASLSGQQDAVATPAVAVVVPASMPARLGDLLAALYGDGVVVETATTIRVPVPADPRVWLLWDEWALARAVAAGVQVLAMPFRDELVLVAEPGAVPDDGVLPTWEAIAMAPALHDRLGLVGPEVDGGMWLAAMQQRLLRGDGEDAGIALWTTLDARAGRLYDDPAAVARDLAAGRLAAAIGPRRWFHDVVDRHAVPLRVAAVPGVAWRGIAVAAGGGERARRLAADLQEPERLRALAAAVGLTVVEPRPVSLQPELARHWWQRFDTQVRGRGRGAEQLADWLDLAFGIGFLVCGWFVWRALRNSPPPVPAA